MVVLANTSRETLILVIVLLLLALVVSLVMNR